MFILCLQILFVFDDRHTHTHRLLSAHSDRQESAVYTRPSSFPVTSLSKFLLSAFLPGKHFSLNKRIEICEYFYPNLDFWNFAEVLLFKSLLDTEVKKKKRHLRKCLSSCSLLSQCRILVLEGLGREVT